MINPTANSDQVPSGAQLVDGADLSAPSVVSYEVHAGAFSAQDLTDYDEWAASQDFG
jgi:hypothetical protein